MSGRSTEELRQGWCPGALRPMPARDGLLVRLRITGGIVSASTARAIADLAEDHGNGLLDLSARANLQLRGVKNDALPALHKGLGFLGLLDDDPSAEAVRNVLGSPLAGLSPSGGAGSSPRPDIRPLVAALEQALVADPALRALPPKFGVLIDDGGSPSLDGIAADLRFRWDGNGFVVGLGGTAADALDLGSVAPNALVERALMIAHRLLALPGAPRRPRRLVEEVGRAAAAAWFGARASRPRSPVEEPEVVGSLTLSGVPVLGLAAPFGRLEGAMLRAAADASAGELRLTPWRTILLPGVVGGAVAGFVTDPADPRLRVAACAGMHGCHRGTTDTHADAARLAPTAGAEPGRGVVLHVSGCAKGCAHPAAAPLTLVGREGRYDLLCGGRPGDTATVRGVAADQVENYWRRVASASGAAFPVADRGSALGTALSGGSRG